LGYEYIEREEIMQSFLKTEIEVRQSSCYNTEESNISSISDKNDYLDRIFEILISEYDFPVDNTAIYYIFDRDPKSNLDKGLIRKLIGQLKNAYENYNGQEEEFFY